MLTEKKTHGIHVPLIDAFIIEKKEKGTRVRCAGKLKAEDYCPPPLVLTVLNNRGIPQVLLLLSSASLL